MYDLSTEPVFYNELLDELKLFAAYYEGESVRVDGKCDAAFCCSVKIADKRYSFDAPASDSDSKKFYKRFVKKSLYSALSDYYGIELPWGSLTGIRPTKLAYEFLGSGGNYADIEDYMAREFLVSREKAGTVARIIESQRDCVRSLDRKVNLYIHIPFCDGRCTYCSFPSADVNKHGELLEHYVGALIREISDVKQLIRDRNLDILSVYVGGGTPSVLSCDQIERLLGVIDCNNCEFTFEAGRPDSVSAKKFEIMKRGGVTRVCVNPQTLNDSTLVSMGRRHTAADFFRVYELASSFGFSVNTDIIAGLQGETLSDFERTLDGVAKLSPDNITVHTLSRKRGSELAESVLECAEIDSMMNFAYDKLNNYRPYYLYRQKYMIGNLENVGFCLEGKECVNNVTVMEELVPVFACGAGSISKSITGGKIGRHASIKDVSLYLKQFDERLARKLEFLSAEQSCEK